MSGWSRRRGAGRWLIFSRHALAVTVRVGTAELKSLGHQEGVGGDAQFGVMAKPAPAPTLVVVQAEVRKPSRPTMKVQEGRATIVST